MAVKIVELYQVSPSAGAAAEQILPLLYFDIAWIPMNPSQTLYFYNFQHPESHFLNSIVPKLKNSLSLTLKHFLPLAGKIVFPLTSSSMPFSHYTGGNDSLSLTIAVSDSDFFWLSRNDLSRDTVEFHDFIPTLPPAVYSSDLIKFSVAAVQVTLFPNHGICVGFTNHHAICDATGVTRFLKIWASINKLNGESHLNKKLLPSYDRSRVEGANDLTTVFWNHVKMLPPVVSTLSPPTFKVRGSFVLTEVQIRSLKKFLMNQNPPVGRISSHVAVCAHVWSCLAAADGEKVDENEIEYLSVSVDCRERLSPTLPPNYFGNCMVFALAELTHGRLKGKDGFVAAARAIAAVISKTVDSGGGVLDGAEETYIRRREVVDKRLIGVSGSPRLDMHGVDFGWGGLRKFELLHIDHNGAMGLSKSKQEGAQIDLSMPNPKMDAFTEIFNKNLSINSNL
ncbi:hypothetical protein C2S51_037420 [Perilla frutescens var. frutescens]|nr:hypothetical protein C2S51_037420 [Perilla frutescens var. frutescens]